MPNDRGLATPRRLLVLLMIAALLVLFALRTSDPRREEHLALEGMADEDLPAPRQRDEYFPGVRGDYLSDVRDDTVFRAVESDAWFHLLALLDKTDPRELRQASLGRVGYLQLTRQAEAYRGRLVTVDGIVRASKHVTAPANAFGIEAYYQIWLQPLRSSPALVVVYCLQLPEGFPLGTRLEEECSATGFFFKRWAYQSQGGIATAPLLVARTLEWQPAAALAEVEPLGEQIVWIVVVSLLLAALGLVMFVARGRAAARRRAQPSDISGWAGVGDPQTESFAADADRRPNG